MKFKEGDKVKIKSNCSGSIAGNFYTLTREDNSSSLRATDEKGISGCSCQNNWILIKEIDIRKLNYNLVNPTKRYKKEPDKLTSK